MKKTVERGRDLRPALAFLLPNLCGFLLFSAGPIAISLFLAFNRWDVLRPPHWVGLGNFDSLLGFHGTAQGWRANDPDFWRYLWNTFFLLLALPLAVGCSLALALVLNQKLRFLSAYRLIFFLPSILYGVAIFYLWKYMFEPDYGLFNDILVRFGLHPLRWLNDPHLAKPSLMLMMLWLTAGGGSMIVYLAALQGVPEELHEAAHIDGAGYWHRFWAVTWPALRPATFFNVTMSLIWGLQASFDVAYIMTDGGPYGSTTTLAYYMYLKAFRFFEMGYASAIAWVLFLVTFLLTLIEWRRSGGVQL